MPKKYGANVLKTLREAPLYIFKNKNTDNTDPLF